MVSSGLAVNLKGWAIMLEIGVVSLAVAAIAMLKLPADATPGLVSATNELAVGAGTLGVAFIVFGIWLRRRRPSS